MPAPRYCLKMLSHIPSQGVLWEAYDSAGNLLACSHHLLLPGEAPSGVSSLVMLGDVMYESAQGRYVCPRPQINASSTVVRDGVVVGGFDLKSETSVWAFDTAFVFTEDDPTPFFLDGVWYRCRTVGDGKGIWSVFYEIAPDGGEVKVAQASLNPKIAALCPEYDIVLPDARHFNAVMLYLIVREYVSDRRKGMHPTGGWEKIKVKTRDASALACYDPMFGM